MKELFCFIVAAFLLLSPLDAYSVENYSEYLPRLNALLQKGSPQEQKYALECFWFLHYEKYRKDSKVFDPILEALNNKNPSVREAAAAFFKRLGDGTDLLALEKLITPALIKALADESPGVRAEAAAALAYYTYNRDQTAAEPLMKCLKDKNFLVRINSVFALGELRVAEAVPALLAVLDDNSDWRNKIVQQECLIALRKINKSDAHVVEGLINKFDDTYLKTEIIKTLGHFQVQAARDLLIKATEDPDEKIRTLAVKALERLVRTETKHVAVEPPPPVQVRTDANGKKSYRAGGFAEFGSGAGPHEKIETKVIDYEGRFDVLLKSIKDPSPDVRVTSVIALGRIKDPKAIAALIEALNDGNQDVKLKAVEALVQLKDESAVQHLIEKLDDNDQKVREKVIQSLKEFSDEKIIDALLPIAGFNYVQDTIVAIAEKNAPGFVYVTRRNGVRTVAATKPESGKYVRFFVYPRVADKLIAGLDTPDINKKIVLLDILDRFADDRVEPILLKQLDDPEARVREYACNSLPLIATDAAITKLITALKDQNPKVRVAAARSLGELQDPRAVTPLIEALPGVTPKKKAPRQGYGRRLMDSPEAQADEATAEILRTLGKYKDSRMVDINIKYLNDKSSRIRHAAAANLVTEPDIKAVELLISLLNDEDNFVAYRALEALGKTKDKRAVEAFLNILDGKYTSNRGFSGDKEMIERAARSLGEMGDAKAILPLIKILSDENKDIRLRTDCAVSLGKIGDERAVKPLEEALAKKLSPGMDNCAKQSLAQIQNRLEAAKLLTAKDDPEITAAIFYLINNPDKRISGTIIGKLTEQKDKKAIEPLTVMLKAKCGISQKREAVNLLAAYDDPEASRILVELIDDPDYYIAEPAMKKVSKSNDTRVREVVAAKIKDGKGSSSFSRNAVKLLAESEDPEIIPALVEALNNPDFTVADPALRKLEQLHDECVIEQLVAALKAGKVHRRNRPGAARVLAAYEDPAGIPGLFEIIKSVKPFYVSICQNAVYKIKEKSAIPYLLEGLHDNNTDVVFCSAKSLVLLNDERGVGHLCSVLKKDDAFKKQRREAARALAEYGAPAVAPAMMEYMDDHDSFIADSCMGALGVLKDETAIPYLLKIIGRGEGKEDAFCQSTTFHDCNGRAFKAAIALSKYDRKETLDIVAGYGSDKDSLVRTGAEIFIEKYKNIREVKQEDEEMPVESGPHNILFAIPIEDLMRKQPDNSTRATMTQ